MFQRKHKLCCTITLIISCYLPSALAITEYTTQSAFLSNLNSNHQSSTENFDTLNVNSAFDQSSTSRGFNINQSSSEVLYISNLYATTSASNYLGLDNTDQSFQANDEITFTFDEPIAGFGLNLVTEEHLQEGDLVIETGITNVNNSSTADSLLNGANSYYLGFIIDDESEVISEVTLKSTNGLFDFNLNLDDITFATVTGNTVVNPSSSNNNSSNNNHHRRGGALGIVSLLTILLILILRKYTNMPRSQS